jgi:ribonucleoside-diphosphate reductase alpha chain
MMTVKTVRVDGQSDHKSKGFRTPLSEKIFLDRYALKSTSRDAFDVGSTVVFSPEVKDGYARREIGLVTHLDVNNKIATVVLRDQPEQESHSIPFDHIDTPLELEYGELCRRVAKSVSSVENTETLAEEAELHFRKILENKDFVPGGRILAGAGAPGDLTYYNCYVVPSPKDSRKGILETAQQQFEIMSRGGGVGINVSSLRPKYDYVKGVNGRSSGAVSWADLYSIITGKVEQGGSRRGALMIILDIWHPDIEQFIKAKHQIGKLDNANISVGVTDDFMEAVESDGDWVTFFPDRNDPDYDALWDGDINGWRAKGKAITQYQTFKARELFNTICQSAWKSAEPGLFFVDRYNKMANSHYYTSIRCTNPCGEQGLPGWGVCNLGALNLSNYVKESESGHSFWSGVSEASFNPAMIEQRIDLEHLADVTRKAVHFLDNIIDKTPYVMVENERQQKGERRVGLGVMGMAEMLIRAGIRYGSEASVEVTNKIFETIRNAAYESSIELSRRRGPFPKFLAESLLESGFSQTLPEYIRDGIRQNGLRNVTLTTIAPTGTTGSMTSTSTGIEPYFMFRFEQRGHLGANIVEEPIVREFRAATGHKGELPDHFVVTEDLGPDEHLGIMAAAQKYIDSSISKTCNLPNDFSVGDIERFYRKLYEMGCKGGTVYRDGSRDVQCLVKLDDPNEAKAEEKVAKPEAPKPEVAPLPTDPRFGLTHSVLTHLGRVHVTLNLDVDNDLLFDVFIRLSKAGSDIDADTDAIGRLISLMLRLNSNVPTKRRLQLVIGQLRGIASSQSIGFGVKRVRSVPDGVALCLQTLLDKVEDMRAMQQLEKDMAKMTQDDAEAVDMGGLLVPGTMQGKKNSNGQSNGKGKAKVRNRLKGVEDKSKAHGFILMCPSCQCASAVKADGCFKCISCGYSEC